ncbi:unnamed protein product [Amoebophrya sp. A120]|nr:unnamed protein product [Amoebophrya sp. A120]|eukprot:GSA120T00019584001.1
MCSDYSARCRSICPHGPSSKVLHRSPRRLLPPLRMGRETTMREQPVAGVFRQSPRARLFTSSGRLWAKTRRTRRP